MSIKLHPGKKKEMTNLFWAICQRFIYAVIGSMVFSSCAIYTSQVVPPVAIENKKELQLDAGMSFAYASLTPGINFSAAFGLNDHFYSQLFSSYTVWDVFHAEANLGYYRKLNDGKRIDIQGGYFYGEGIVEQLSWYNIHVYGQNGSYQGPYVKLQYSNISKSNPVQTGVSLKTALISPNVAWQLNDERSDETSLSGFYKKDGLLIEPGAFIRYHKKKSSIFFMLSYSFIYYLKKPENCLPYDGYGNLNFGYSYTFNLSKKNR